MKNSFFILSEKNLSRFSRSISRHSEDLSRCILPSLGITETEETSIIHNQGPQTCQLCIIFKGSVGRNPIEEILKYNLQISIRNWQML